MAAETIWQEVMMVQFGFFDADKRLSAPSAKGDPLVVPDVGLAVAVQFGAFVGFKRIDVVFAPLATKGEIPCEI